MDFRSVFVRIHYRYRPVVMSISNINFKDCCVVVNQNTQALNINTIVLNGQPSIPRAKRFKRPLTYKFSMPASLQTF